MNLLFDRDAGANVTKILNAFFESGYDKRVRPNYGGDSVVQFINIQFIIDHVNYMSF